jgi:hypothetical protein
MMGSSCYSGAAINYSKRSFKTKNLSRKKLSDSNEKTKQKKKKISISEEERSHEGEAFGREQERSDGRKNNNTPSRRSETSFYGPAPFGTSIKTPLTCPHVPAEFMATRQKYQRTFRENIPHSFS